MWLVATDFSFDELTGPHTPCWRSKECTWRSKMSMGTRKQHQTTGSEIHWNSTLMMWHGLHLDASMQRDVSVWSTIWSVSKYTYWYFTFCMDLQRIITSMESMEAAKTFSHLLLSHQIVRWLCVSSMSEANLSEACNTLWKSAEFACWGAHKLKGTQDIHAQTHTHSSGLEWFSLVPKLTSGHYGKVYQRRYKDLTRNTLPQQQLLRAGSEARGWKQPSS